MGRKIQPKNQCNIISPKASLVKRPGQQRWLRAQGPTINNHSAKGRTNKLKTGTRPSDPPPLNPPMLNNQTKQNSQPNNPLSLYQERTYQNPQGCGDILGRCGQPPYLLDKPLQKGSGRGSGRRGNRRGGGEWRGGERRGARRRHGRNHRSGNRGGRRRKSAQRQGTRHHRVALVESDRGTDQRRGRRDEELRRAPAGRDGGGGRRGGRPRGLNNRSGQRPRNNRGRSGRPGNHRNRLGGGAGGGGDRSSIRLPRRGFSPPAGLRLAAKRTRDLGDLETEGIPPGLGGSLSEEATVPEEGMGPGGKGGRDLKVLDQETKNRDKNYLPDRTGISDPCNIDTS